MNKPRANENKTLEETLRSIPETLSSLQRADRLGAESRPFGFDHPDADSAVKKVEEELSEVKAAISGHESRERIVEEFGDLFLSVSCAARLCGVDSEEALQKANEKYLSRISSVEQQCIENGSTMKAATRENLLLYWQNAKKMEDNH